MLIVAFLSDTQPGWRLPEAGGEAGRLATQKR